MFTSRFLPVALLLVASPHAFGQALDTVERVRACAAANAPDKLFALVAAFSTTDGSEQEATLATRMYGFHDRESLTINLMIQEPAKLTGTAFYVKEQPGQDDMRVYVPALRKTRRVTGSMAARELWGTSFSYLDIKQMLGAFVGGRQQLLPDAEYLGKPVKVMEIYPEPAESAPFQRVEIFLDPETCVPLTADYQDAEGQALKRLRTERETIQKLGNHYVATELTMTDLVSGKTTEVTVSEVRFDENIPRSAFSPNSFHRAP